MSSGVKYRLDKSRYMLYNTALETLGVVAETEHGTAIFHPSQTQGVVRDHLNRKNLYKKINNFFVTLENCGGPLHPLLKRFFAIEKRLCPCCALNVPLPHFFTIESKYV